MKAKTGGRIRATNIHATATVVVAQTDRQRLAFGFWPTNDCSGNPFPATLCSPLRRRGTSPRGGARPSGVWDRHDEGGLVDLEGLEGPGEGVPVLLEHLLRGRHVEREQAPPGSRGVRPPAPPCNGGKGSPDPLHTQDNPVRWRRVDYLLNDVNDNSSWGRRGLVHNPFLAWPPVPRAALLDAHPDEVVVGGPCHVEVNEIHAVAPRSVPPKSLGWENAPTRL